MSFRLQGLQKGDVVTAEFVEQVDGNHFILSFGGQLIRVQDDSRRQRAVGSKVNLRVVSVNPLRFQLNERRGRLDRHC